MCELKLFYFVVLVGNQKSPPRTFLSSISIDKEEVINKLDKLKIRLTQPSLVELIGLRTKKKITTKIIYHNLRSISISLL